MPKVKLIIPIPAPTGKISIPVCKVKCQVKLPGEQEFMDPQFVKTTKGHIHDNLLGSTTEFEVPSGSVIKCEIVDLDPAHPFMGWNEIQDNSQLVFFTDEIIDDVNIEPRFEGMGTTYMLQLLCDPTKGFTLGSGIYAYGADVVITAACMNGFRFLSWSDGNLNYQRNIRVVEPITLTAIFAPDSGDSVAVNTICDPTEGSVIGGGVLLKGSGCSIQAIPNEGYEFKYWVLGDNIVAENPYKTFVDQSITVQAVFEKLLKVEAIYDDQAALVVGGGYYHEGDEVVIDVKKGDLIIDRGCFLDNKEVYTPLKFKISKDCTFEARISKMYTGHVDEEGLKLIGWTDEDIALLTQHIVWDSFLDRYYKVEPRLIQWYNENKDAEGYVTTRLIKNVITQWWFNYVPKFKGYMSDCFNYSNFLVRKFIIAMPNLSTNISSYLNMCGDLIYTPPLAYIMSPMSSSGYNNNAMREAMYKNVGMSQGYYPESWWQSSPRNFNSYALKSKVYSESLNLDRVEKLKLSDRRVDSDISGNTVISTLTKDMPLYDARQNSPKTWIFEANGYSAGIGVRDTCRTSVFCIRGCNVFNFKYSNDYNSDEGYILDIEAETISLDISGNSPRHIRLKSRNVATLNGSLNKSILGRILVPSNMVEAYKADSTWGHYSDYIESEE